MKRTHLVFSFCLFLLMVGCNTSSVKSSHSSAWYQSGLYSENPEFLMSESDYGQAGKD